MNNGQIGAAGLMGNGPKTLWLMKEGLEERQK